MKTIINHFVLCLALCLVTIGVQAQQPEMADGLRSEGKIYVVVAIIVIVLIGFVGYLIFLDKKLNRLEKLVREKKTK